MKYPNGPELKAYLRQSGHSVLALWPRFRFKMSHFAVETAIIKAQHPALQPDHVAARAAYRLLTYKRWAWLAALLVLVSSGFAQTTNVKPCIATAAAPSYSEGAAAFISCDLAGNLRTSGGAAGGSAITTWGGGTLGAMAAYGTSPGAVLVPGMNAFITNVPHIVCDSGCASGGSSTPADTFSNPTTAGLSMAFPMLWNGTTWDRQYGDKTNGAFVNVKTSVLPTGAALDSSLTTLDADLKANVTLHSGTAVIGHVIADTGSTTAVTGNVAVTNAGLSNIDVLLSTRTKPADQQHAIIDSGTTVVTQGTGTNLHTVVDSGAVNATLGAETTKVIGTVNQGTSPWVTSSTLATETTKVIGTVNQGTSPWVTSATLAAETTKVIGTVRASGNTGAALDAATNGAIPANQVWVVSAPTTAAGGSLSSSSKSTVTSSVNVKASAGSVYGISVLNGAGAGCWLELINSATAGTLGTAVIFNIALPTSGTLTIPPGVFALGNFSSGIAVGAASAIGGSSACGTAVTGVTIFFQ